MKTVSPLSPLSPFEPFSSLSITFSARKIARFNKWRIFAGEIIKTISSNE